MPLEEAENPFFCGQSMKDNFPTYAYLTRIILSIHGNQIETDKVFSVVGIFTNLCWCRLGAKNLDLLVLLIKNWLDDPTTIFDDKASLVDLDVFGEVEEDILYVIDSKFPNEVDDYLKECI